MENEQTETTIATQKVSKDALLVSGAIVLGSLLIGTVLLVTTSRGSIVGSVQNTPETGTDTPTAPTAQNPGTNPAATVSIDDDAVLGDKKKAKVAIVEFSDYECPYCKRFHQETYDKLVKEYVDTGKAIFVFRDYPLSFHDPKATEEAQTAECVRAQKGDKAYFSFGQALFANSQTNGKGLPEGKLDELLRSVGANATTVKSCVSADKYKDEVAKDMADGQEAGVTGTPSFIVGTLDDKGNVTGEKLVGAAPIERFKTVVGKYLDK